MKNKKEKLVGIAAIFLLCTVLWNTLVYGMFAFVLWQASPAEWSEASRMLFGYFGCICGIFIAGGLAAYFGSDDSHYC